MGTATRYYHQRINGPSIISARRPSVVATLPFRFRFFFQAALDGVRPPKPVFMILDVRYLDPKTPYSFNKVFGQHPHTCSRAFSTRCCPSSLTPKLRCSRASQVTWFQACRWLRKKGHPCRHFHHHRYRIHQEWI
jgi:hypothetical protein